MGSERRQTTHIKIKQNYFSPHHCFHNTREFHIAHNVCCGVFTCDFKGPLYLVLNNKPKLYCFNHCIGQS